MKAPAGPAPMVGADVLARQWQRYGQIVSDELALDPVYSESQCRECQYGDRCCDLVVTVTPYEALGILSWLKANVSDWREVLGLVKMRADALRDFIVDKMGKPQHENPEAMMTAWWQRGIKCVFYDRTLRGGRGGCSIYPVRPVNCRKVFGRGDCGDERASGVTPMVENPAMYSTRATRVRVRQLEAYGQDSGELCSLLTMLRSPQVNLVSEPADQRLLQTPPELLTDDQVLWGLGARPMDNPWHEDEAHGSS